MTQFTKDGQDQVSDPWVDYGCSPWRLSSQRASDLYESGVKLWRREDLADIEQQLVESFSMKKFTVRRINGSIIYIKNPMFGVLKPICTQTTFQSQVVPKSPPLPGSLNAPGTLVPKIPTLPGALTPRSPLDPGSLIGPGTA
ncbi:hypothetical protein V493_08047 [Pseudogymnoascus sp. VKM F-4281 (FW-2241)]|nr:hypothetical protein V493_08047 [Pseudogymnoascus sp. VKM F-4281 (FW-2241)]